MTRRQFRALYREFLFRLTDVELLSAHAQGDMSKLLGQFAALLIFFSVLLAILAMPFLGRGEATVAQLAGAWNMQHFLVATTMLAVGLFAVLSWDSAFPSRRDVLVLAPLPIRARTLFLAKVAAVATALGLTVAILHLAAGLVWPLAFARASPRTAPALTYHPAMPAVTAAGLGPVLDRYLVPAFRNGPLAAGSGAGMIVGVSQHGVRRVFTYGTARPDSIFEIGSISKTFTGLLLAQMAEQGAVRLDEPVRNLLPPGTVPKPAGREITLLDLATQHSGLPRNPGNIQPANWANPLADYHAADLYAFLARHGVAKPAKSSFLYSNLGFALLGQALAERAGITYPELIRREIASPLGLKDTVVSLSSEQQSRLMAGRHADHHPAPPWDMDVFAASGGIRSTAGDMLTYLEAQLHPDGIEAGPGTLLAAVAQSQRFRARAWPGVRIALAWAYNEDTGIYWHNGGTGGFSSYAFFHPKGGYAGVVLLNARPGGLIPFADLLGEHLRQRLAGESAISLDTVAVPATGGALGVIRAFAAYWITMFAAGAFIFCSVLGMQGAAAQLFPHRWFLRASSFLQLATFCAFVCLYFLQRSPAYALVVGPNQPLLAWIPSYWFVGLFQQLNGSLHPALGPLAQRAWMSLLIAVCATIVAYASCYFRMVRRFAEEPDIVPDSRRGISLPHLGDSLQTAIVQFSIRTLLRSRQHRLLLAFYLGIGFAITILFLKTPLAQRLSAGTASDAWQEVSMPLLVSSILTLGFWIVGMRVVFSLPLNLPANWIFRVTPIRGGLECLAARRLALYVLGVAPVWTLWAVLFLSIWPWQAAVGHLVVLALLGLILAELCLHGAQKIPFSCSYLPGKSNFHITFWLCIGLLVILVAKGAELEGSALQNPSSYVTMLLLLGIAALLARWRTAAAAQSEERQPQFEEEPLPVILSLGLHRDGTLLIQH